MSYEGKFAKAVEIVQGLPKDGPVKPTQDEQLYVRRSQSTPEPPSTDRIFYSVLQILQTRSDLA